ncbi:MAG: chemotaxis protein CheA [Gammaproteobacteria bacterium]|nr:chemotaxis protein CheA [Gammaproteobacteria bacterium]
MAMEEDAELLQDFLVEAGEILEQLGEQLVELENRPQDNDLLNAVFRGFHTIKGGASFLSLDALVNICHRAEDVFNVLRNGERSVDAEVMDVILPVLDVLNEQFATLRSGQEPQHADPQLLARLESLMQPGAAPPEPVATQPMVAEEKPPLDAEAATSQTTSDDITEDEFEQLLDSLSSGKNAGAKAPKTEKKADKPQADSTPTASSDEITEDEFEALLDQLDSQRKSGSTQSPAPEAPVKANSGTDAVEKVASEADKVKPAAKHETSKDEYITEEEFDELLDQIQNKDSKTATSGKPQPAPAKPAAASRSPQKPANSVAAGPGKPADTQVAAKAKEAMAQGETTVRVDTKRLDDIMNLVGELVLVRNRLATLDSVKSDEEMTKVVANLDVVTADLQASVMKTRMQPIKKVFGRFPRVVRDLARNLHKEVNLELQGEDTDLDKNLVEALADPLVHLVRNAVDHGIETPEERIDAGKPRIGTVILTAEQEGDHILLTIEDDGKGMDADQLRRAAVAKGILDEESAARLEAKDCYNLIFAPGFSTKQEISDVSGRGVGMDVVKTRIVQLNGSVEIDSRKGKGSIIIIKVPLTLAIMPTLMVMLERQIFALPLASVNEIFHLDLTRTNVVDGQLVVMVRDKALPLFYLRHWLVKEGFDQPLPHEGHVVVVSMGVQRIGFVVDTLIGQEEVVIKPLGALLHGMKGLAGATITGDGRISLILDIPGLMQRYARRI